MQTLAQDVGGLKRVLSNVKMRGGIGEIQLSMLLQLMWLKELETYRAFPPLQTPASYNLDQVIEAMKDAKHISHAGE